MLKNYCRKLSMSSSDAATIFFAAIAEPLQKFFVRSVAANLNSATRIASLHLPTHFPLPPSEIF